MSMMKLPQFLKKVDEHTKSMSHLALENFVHEFARTLPEAEREYYLDTLEESRNAAANDTEAFPADDGYADIISRINAVIPKFEQINNGKKQLDSEYNIHYEYWRDEDEDEFYFSDPDNLVGDIREAVDLVHECIDMNIYKEGCELCEALCYLEISVTGDYCDSYGDEPLTVKDLYRYDCLRINWDSYVAETLYLTYMGNEPANRAEEMYNLFQLYEYDSVSLEKVLQKGNEGLPDFDNFLNNWIAYLGEQKGHFAEKLLQEAQTLLQDDAKLLENARKYYKEHPSLFEQILEANLENGDNDHKMVDVGLEALDKIDCSLVIRSKIACLTAIYANRLGQYSVKEMCWLEALKSDTTVLNYLRMKFLTANPSQRMKEVKSIVENCYKESQNHKQDYAYRSMEEARNRISKTDYCTILFFEQEFQKIEKLGMSTKESLGWSSTFMKEGIALLLLLLYKDVSYRKGMQDMLERALDTCGFNSKKYYFEELQSDFTMQNRDSDLETFADVFEKWKTSVQLSEKDINSWLIKLEAWIKRRVSGIMAENKRNYYNECASFIAALGEVKESLGKTGGKQTLMLEYKLEYKRRRAFHEALRSYGME